MARASSDAVPVPPLESPGITSKVAIEQKLREVVWGTSKRCSGPHVQRDATSICRAAQEALADRVLPVGRVRYLGDRIAAALVRADRKGDGQFVALAAQAEFDGFPWRKLAEYGGGILCDALAIHAHDDVGITQTGSIGSAAGLDRGNPHSSGRPLR